MRGLVKLTKTARDAMGSVQGSMVTRFLVHLYGNFNLGPGGTYPLRPKALWGCFEKPQPKGGVRFWQKRRTCWKGRGVAAPPRARRAVVWHSDTQYSYAQAVATV